MRYQEQLREQLVNAAANAVNQQTRIWVCGHNMGGYSPESSPYITSSWGSAKDCLLEEIDRDANSLYDGLDTHKYFESGREEWTPAQVLHFAEQYEDAFPHYEQGQWETIMLTDSDKDTLSEIAELDDLVESLSKIVEGEQWGGNAKYIHYWLEESSRSSNDIPADLEGEELDDFLQHLNEMGY